MIDLHTHTKCSDGDKTPAQLVQLCREAQVSVVAITDHDTVDGVEEAVQAGRALGVGVVPGIEISTAFHGKEVHLLGLMIDWHNGTLQEYCARAVSVRQERGRKIIARLRELGIAFSEQEEAMSCHSRAKIGMLLVQKGYAPSVRGAFRKYLGRDGAAFVDKQRIPIREAIHMVHEARGLAILAHLITISPVQAAAAKAVRQLLRFGLDGIECYYGEYTPSYGEFCCQLAQRYHLARSGGSDYHGDSKKGLHLGVGYGSLYIPEQVYEELEQFYHNKYG